MGAVADVVSDVVEPVVQIDNLSPVTQSSRTINPVSGRTGINPSDLSPAIISSKGINPSDLSPLVISSRNGVLSSSRNVLNPSDLSPAILSSRNGIPKPVPQSGRKGSNASDFSPSIQSNVVLTKSTFDSNTVVASERIDSNPVVQSTGIIRPLTGDAGLVSSRTEVFAVPLSSTRNVAAQSGIIAPLISSRQRVDPPQTPPFPCDPDENGNLKDVEIVQEAPAELTIDQLMELEGFDDVVLGPSALNSTLPEDGTLDNVNPASSMLSHASSIVGVSRTLVESIPDEVAIPEAVDRVPTGRPRAPSPAEPTVTPVDPVLHISQPPFTEQSLTEAFSGKRGFEGLSPINAKLSMSDYVSLTEDLKKLEPKTMSRFESTVFIESPSGPRPFCTRFWGRLCPRKY